MNDPGATTAKEALNVHKTFVVEKTIKRERPIRQKQAENLVRRRCSTKDLKSLKYSQFQPLYEMWCEYYSSLVQTSNPDDRLLKADYHGCLMMVADADNKDSIGLHGIVARETRQTFQLITQADRLITIPKKGTTFQFAFEGKVFTLFGDAFRFKPVHRIKKMSKARLSLPFFLD